VVLRWYEGLTYLLHFYYSGIIYCIPNLKCFHAKVICIKIKFVIDSIFQLFTVGILWGSTNPFLKAATNKVKRNKTFNIISEVIDHLTNWHVSTQYVLHIYTIHL